MTPVYWLAAALLGLLFDVLTTLYVLRAQDGRELNGLMGWLMGRIGIGPALWLSHGIAAVFCVWAWRVGYPAVVIMFAVMFGSVTLWNLNQIRKGRR